MRINPNNARKSLRPRTTAVVYTAAVLALGVTALIFGRMSPTRALFINPTSPPPGGQASIPLNSSDTAQTKTGSLVLGGKQTGCDAADPNTRSGCAKLCLNSGDVTPDITKCISAWTDLRGIGDTALLKLSGEVTPTAQSGYVFLSGAPNETNPTLSISLPVESPFGTTALYAEGNSIDNYAGYFNGDVKIKGATADGNGRLCLNGTGTRNDGLPESVQGHFCITAWDQLSSIITDKLTLQTSLPTEQMTEYGHVGISKAFNSASVVLGEASDIPLAYQCGDGMCNSSGIIQETIGNCPVDCAPTSMPASFSAVYASSSTATITVTTTPVLPANTQIQILVVRSTVENFSFTPMDGVTYSTTDTQYGPSLAIVFAQNFPQVNSGAITRTFTDTFTQAPKYYYRAYQGNAFPRYGAASVEKTVTFNSTAPPAETVSLPIQVAP